MSAKTADERSAMMEARCKRGACESACAVQTDSKKRSGNHDDLCTEGDMAADLNELQTLLVEIGAFAAIVEDHEIFKISSLDPLIARARSLGVVVPAPGTLDDLRGAVEKACGHAQGGATESGAGSAPITARDILGNESGIPGDGP